MAFAIFYNIIDLQKVAAALTDTTLRGQDRTDAQGYWNGGFSTYQTAPVCPADRADGDPDCRTLVTTYKTLADFRTLCWKLAARPGNEALSGVCYDLSGAQAAAEPWP